MPPSAGAPGVDPGAPDSGACVEGTPCEIEGSQCTDSSDCCVIRDTCDHGSWRVLAFLGPCRTDPPAAPFECSAAPPTEGSACGVCAHQCPYDTCTPDGGGKNFVSACDDGKWHDIEIGCLTCCHGDTDCPRGMCVRARCEWLDHGDGCFRDAECAAGQICGGAQICPCGSPCPWNDHAGTCVPANLGCCATNDDCSRGQVCIAGVCKGPAAAGRCWTNADCGVSCYLPSVCPCGSSCLVADEPGKCLMGI